LGQVNKKIFLGRLIVSKKREFTVIIEKGEDDYLIGTVLELRGCHTQGKDLDELIDNIKEAIQLYLEVEEPGEEYIKEIVGLQKVVV